MLADECLSLRTESYSESETCVWYWSGRYSPLPRPEGEWNVIACGRRRSRDSVDEIVEGDEQKRAYGFRKSCRGI